KEARSGTGGRTPFGYKSTNGEVSIVEGEAEIVRRIFSEYLKPGGSLLAIAGELNRRKVPSMNTSRGIARKTGGVWRGSSVRSILERRKYLGEFVYGAKNGGRYFAMRDGEIVPRRKSDKFTQAEPVTHAGRFEAIIDQETFDRAQAKLGGNRTKTSRRSAHQYLLAGLVKCGDCGGAMGGSKPKNPRYHCRLYHQSGSSVCYCNTISEAPLVSCIVRKIQEKYLSPAALDRLRKALAQEQERTRPRPRDLSRLRKEIDVLDQKIDQGAERILEVSSEIVPMLVRKVEEFKSERDRLNQELESLARHETRSNGKDDSEIDRAIKALKTLGKALERAKPEDTRDLLSSIVSKIELFYDHEETAGGRKTSEFSHGLIHLRPTAGEARGTQPDSGNSTHMNNNRPIFAMVGFRLPVSSRSSIIG
ncbi:MAG: recombinase family protein, partial [Planctomycetota bacterium]|nr:recombinase family protein [Planctomycetota bacterium]